MMKLSIYFINNFFCGIGQNTYTIIVFVDIIHHPFFYLKPCFRDCILSPSSGKSLFIWAQLIELIPISGPQNIYIHLFNKNIL
jgi:hypothetical protein